MSMKVVPEMGSRSIPVSYLALLPSPLPAKSGNERWRYEKMGSLRYWAEKRVSERRSWGNPGASYFGEKARGSWE